MCPFCYIGKRKFEKALEQFHNKDEISIEWKSFQLMPGLKTEGDKNADEFLAEQLKTERFIAACEAAHYPARINMRAGYDHSYFFINTFIESHLHFHAQALSS